MFASSGDGEQADINKVRRVKMLSLSPKAFGGGLYRNTITKYDHFTGRHNLPLLIMG